MGEGLGDFMSSSPGLHRLNGGKFGKGGSGLMGGSMSARTTPKNKSGFISASPGLRIQNLKGLLEQECDALSKTPRDCIREVDEESRDLRALSNSHRAMSD